MENVIHHKMKIVLILITYVLINNLRGTKGTSLQFPDLQPQRYDVPIVNFKGVNQSILYYKGSDNDMLINFILEEVFKNQPVLLLSGDDIITEGVNNEYPNIILLAEDLNIEDFETEPFKTLLISYWSLLYLVITTRSEKYTCENGTLNEDAIVNTKNYLNELWQKFNIVRVTVSFPYTCPNLFVIYDGKEWSGTDVYNRSIRLIRPQNISEYKNSLAVSGDPHYLAKDFPLRVNIFNRFPTSITECGFVSQYTNIDFRFGNKLCGLDGLIMHDYLLHYKFNLSLPTDTECDSYGYQDKQQNNSITGSLGCIVREQIDISFNSRFVWQYTKKSYNYLHYVYQDSLCIVMKRARKVPLWHYAGNIFTPLIWTVLLSSISFIGTVEWLSAKISTRFSKKRPLKLHKYLINSIYSALFGILLRNDKRFLTLKGTSLLCSVILTAVYQGHFSYQFATRSHYHEIKTLEQLYRSTTILSTSKSITVLLKPSVDLTNPYQAAFLDRIQIRNTTSIEYLLEHPNIATLARKQDVMIEVLQNHTDKYGMPLVYVVDDCLHSYYLAYIARRGFLFLEESQKFMMRVLEAGLPRKYYIWTRNTFNLADHWPGTGPAPRPFKAISFKKMRIAFGILLLGYLVSGFIFIVELRIGRSPGNKNFSVISR